MSKRPRWSFCLLTLSMPLSTNEIRDTRLGLSKDDELDVDVEHWVTLGNACQIQVRVFCRNYCFSSPEIDIMLIFGQIFIA